jgi:Fe-S-cluster containining protein
MTSVPFYTSGLKFSCKRCSSCCRYEAGFVFLSENDLKKLITKLNMNRNSFIGTYCRWVTEQNGKEVLSLKEKNNKDCILWDSGCMVYTDRPTQCRTFPFWASIVATARSWEMAASGCPGMNTGKLHSEKAISGYIKMSAVEPKIERQGE